ncbi:MAG: ribosome biogenesis GTPase Der [Armatimonadota bacterium]
MLPIVAIVGRTNVGKSQLFNRLVGERTAVVDDVHGVTRDRVTAVAELDQRSVRLVDTGGLAGAGNDELITEVKEQAVRALAEADVLIFLVDGRQGLTPMDHEVADVVRKTGKPVVLAANKMEQQNIDSYEFLQLGLGPAIDISAMQGFGLWDLCEAVEDVLPETTEEEPAEDEVSIAVVGRPNVGKSALVNAILGEERVIVSDVPGTTRDAVDEVFEREGWTFRIVDTAGLRRRSKRQDTEYYSSLRTFKAVARADVVFFMVDAHGGIVGLDQKIAGELMELGRGVIIVGNKWDLVARYAQPDEEFPEIDPVKVERTLEKDFERIVRHELQFLQYAPLIVTCALTGFGVEELLNASLFVRQRFYGWVDEGELNAVLREAASRHNPPSRKGRHPKIFNVEQVRSGPPTFVIFCSDPQLIHFSYKRYISNQIRKEFDFTGTPLRIFWRKRGEKKKSDR